MKTGITSNERHWGLIMNVANLIRASISESQIEEAIASTHNISCFFHLWPIKDCCLCSIFEKILPTLSKMSQSQGLLPLPWRKNYTDWQLSVARISQDVFPDVQLNVSLQNSLCFSSAHFYQGKTPLPASEIVTLSQHTPLVPDQENYQKTSGKPRPYSKVTENSGSLCLHSPTSADDLHVTCTWNRRDVNRVQMKECNCQEESRKLQFNSHCYSGIAWFFNLDSFVLLLKQSHTTLDYLFTVP